MAVSTTVINTVARRLRDVANLAYPRVKLIRYVDHAQRIINAHLQAVQVGARPLAPFTTACTLHRIDTMFGTGVVSDIVSLRANGIASGTTAGEAVEVIDRVPWQSIVHQDPAWLTAVGKRYISWSTIGKNLLILYPSVRNVDTTAAHVGSIVITYVPTIPSVILDNGSDDIALPDELIPLLQDLVEVLGLLTGRRWSEAADPIARLQQALDAARRTYIERYVKGRV